MNPMETDDIVLRKAKFEDWESMHKNVWSRPEPAKYMQWQIPKTEESAKERIKKTITYQKTHDTYLIYEKEHGQAIGFAGVEEISPHIFQDAGIALVPEYTGKGLGKQTLQLLLEYWANTMRGKEFFYSTRGNNKISKALALSCGFSYQYSEEKIDLKNKEPYILEVYSRKL